MLRLGFVAENPRHDHKVRVMKITVIVVSAQCLKQLMQVAGRERGLIHDNGAVGHYHIKKNRYRCRICDSSDPSFAILHIAKDITTKFE